MFYQQLPLQRYFSRIFYIVTAVYLTINEFVDYFWNPFLLFYKNIFFMEIWLQIQIFISMFYGMGSFI